MHLSLALKQFQLATCRLARDELVDLVKGGAKAPAFRMPQEEEDVQLLWISLLPCLP
jgi:hypothetical protein